MSVKINNKFLVHYLPVFGCVSTGIVYVAIGIIALLSFLKITKGGADESSLVAILNDSLIGNVLIWIIVTGSVSYIIWRIYESLKDPYEYGDSGKGVFIRTGIALSSIADALIVYSALHIIFGSGSNNPNQQLSEVKGMVEGLLKKDFGNIILMLSGGIIFLTAITQAIYGVSNGYKERINIEDFNRPFSIVIYILAWTGYLARGNTIGITGFFLIKAGALNNAGYVVNTDKAFDFLGDYVGNFYFVLVAIGTICYGIFTFALGYAYDVDKD